MIVGLLPESLNVKLDTFDFEKDSEYISKWKCYILLDGELSHRCINLQL